MKYELSYQEETMLQRAQEARNACNLSGVLFSFAEDMQIICDIANKNGYGTHWKNFHPVVGAYIEALNNIRIYTMTMAR
jgi:hypothetical protein